MKKLIVFLLIVVVVLLVFPVSNLFAPRAVPPEISAKSTDPELQKIASVMAGKCMDCHSTHIRRPFYSGLPIAKGMMEADVLRGMDWFNSEKEYFSGDPLPSEAILAKTQRVLENNSMPPLRYKLLHWSAGVGAQEMEEWISWIRRCRAKANGAEGSSDPMYREPLLPLAEVTGLNPDKVALGNLMFHDNRLSADDSLSCASCHDLQKGGSDEAQFSTGINGQVGGINSPTVYNSDHNLLQFWDGRSTDLQDQANGPVANPIEMGSNWEQVLGKLTQDKEVVAAFEALYENGLTSDNITDAIAEFEKSLTTPNSKFDRYLGGNEGALSAAEQEGYALFKSSGCATCHVGQALGGKSFEKVSRFGDYLTDRGDIKEPDNGRFNFTKDESDRHKFKVPILRNIAHTWPYLHDGSTSDLAAVVRMMAKYEVDQSLTDEQVDQMVQFLNALNGEYQGQLLQ